MKDTNPVHLLFTHLYGWTGKPWTVGIQDGKVYANVTIGRDRHELTRYNTAKECMDNWKDECRQKGLLKS